MDLKYFTAGKSFDIDLKWFDEYSKAEYQNVVTAIECCAKDYYRRNDGWDDPSCKFPTEIALCIGNREIGRAIVDIHFEPKFECQ